MIQFRFRINLTVDDTSEEAEARAAQQFLMQLAAEIIRGAAQMNDARRR